MLKRKYMYQPANMCCVHVVVKPSMKSDQRGVNLLCSRALSPDIYDTHEQI